MSLSWLEKVGHDIVAVFEKAAPIVAEVQTVAAPFENIYFPGLSTVITSTLTAIANAEATGVAAAADDPAGNNAAKLASVVAAIAPQLQTVVTAAGFNYNNASANTFVSAIVSAANAFVAVSAATVPPTTATPAFQQIITAPKTGAAA